MKNKSKNFALTAWRIRNGDSAQYIYRLQTPSLGKKLETPLLAHMKSGEWSIVGDSINSSGECSYIFSRSFSSETSWVAWMNASPFLVNELSSTGNNIKRTNSKKIAKLEKRKELPQKSKKSKKRTEGLKRKKKTCSICGELGHNSRTCTKQKDN